MSASDGTVLFQLRLVLLKEVSCKANLETIQKKAIDECPLMVASPNFVLLKEVSCKANLETIQKKAVVECL